MKQMLLSCRPQNALAGQDGSLKVLLQAKNESVGTHIAYCHPDYLAKCGH